MGASDVAMFGPLVKEGGADYMLQGQWQITRRCWGRESRSVHSSREIKAELISSFFLQLPHRNRIDK